MEVESIVPVHAGASQLLAALCDELGIERLVNEAVEWNPSYWKHSPGLHVKALIINALCSRRPLYVIEEFYRDLDMPLLFGGQVEARDLNDDVLGRTLDRLHEAESWKVYSSVSLSVLRKLELPLDTLHSDTTSFSFQGDYANTKNLKVTYGHNKDKRPDLKQVVIGLGVTPQRLPIAAKVEDGNLDDKTWNHAFITRLRSRLSDEEWSQLTYVADSALATKDNLDLMMSKPRLQFITRLPDTFGLCAELKEEAFWRGTWENVGPFGECDAKATYKVQSFSRNLYGYDLHFVVVHSDQLESLQTETLRRQLAKEHETVNKQVERLQVVRFACEHDARQAIDEFKKQHKWKWHTCDFTVEAQTAVRPRSKRGRPKADEVPQTETQWLIVACGIRLQDETMIDKTQKLGMFVLMTSHSKDEHWTGSKVLQTYKGQAAAETRFRLLKDPAFLDAMYLKHPHRIEALGMVMVMALLVYGVLEWRVREQLKQAANPLILPGRRKSFTPTAEMLLTLLQPIQVMICTTTQGQPSRVLSSRLDDNVKRVVELAGFDMAIYTSAPVGGTNR